MRDCQNNSSYSLCAMKIRQIDKCGLSLLRQWGCSGSATESLPYLGETTDRLTIMLFCDVHDIDIGATLNVLVV